MSWHADRPLLAAYAEGRLDDARALSLEAHLLSCAQCRGRAAAGADGARLERGWEQVELALDAPRAGLLERLLVRLGAGEDSARLLAATPSLSAAWLLAVALALGFAVLAAGRGDKGLVAFLVIAPLMPVAGVAAAYGRALDPLHELALSSPAGGFRLLLVRAIAVLTTTAALTGAAALALPGLDWTAAAWLVPALALTALSLALSTYVPPVTASAALASAWVAGVVTSGLAADDRLAAFRAPAQVALLVAGLAAAVVVARRREHFEIERRP